MNDPARRRKPAALCPLSQTETLAFAEPLPYIQSMSNHELILLSPYRLPTHHSLYLADEDVAAFLNGLAVLWHPAALHDAVGPPRVASAYDH